MISQELLKLVLPWLLVLLWLARIRRFRMHRAAWVTLYITVFAGFSANFTPYYREIGQGFSLLVGAIAVIQVFQRGTFPRFALPFLWFGTFILASLLLNPITEMSRAATLNFLTVSLVAMWVVLNLLDPAKRNVFFEHFVLLAAVLAVSSIVEAVLNGARAEATFSNTNYLAYFLGIASCVALFTFGGSRRWLLFLLICGGIFFTRSRAGIAFPVISIAFYMYSLGARRLVIVAPVLLLVATLLVLVPSVMPGLGREDSAGSDAERLVAIEAGIAMTQQNPFAGVGWGRYMEEFWGAASNAPSLFDETRGRVHLSRDMVSHNDPIRVFAELGVVAGLFFLGMLAWSAGRTLRLAADIRYAWAGMLAGSVLFSLAHNNLNSALFWIVAVYPFAARDLRGGVATPGSPSDGDHRLVPSHPYLRRAAHFGALGLDG